MKKMKISELKLHPDYEKINSKMDPEFLAVLMASIELYGQVEAVVIDADDYIISGRHRVEALRNLGRTEVKVVKEADLIANEKTRKWVMMATNIRRKIPIQTFIRIIEYLIAEKEVVFQPGARNDLLGEEAEPVNTRKVLAQKLGISEGMVQKILFLLRYDKNGLHVQAVDSGKCSLHQAYTDLKREIDEQKAFQKEQSDTPETPEYTEELTLDATKDSFSCRDNLSGDSSGEKHVTLYSEDGITVIQGSSLTMQELPDNSVDLIVCSPSYFMKRKYSDDDEELGLEVDYKDYIINLLRFFAECYRVLKHTGSLFINIGDTKQDGFFLALPDKLLVRLLEEQHWYLNNDIEWKKINNKPGSAKRCLNNVHERIFHLVKSKDFYYQVAKIKTKGGPKVYEAPRHRNVKPNHTKYNPSSPIFAKELKNAGDCWMEALTKTARKIFLSKEGWTEDYLETPVAHQKDKIFGGEHSAIMDETLPQLIILQACPKGGLVVDNFGGSGTTAIAAKKLGRRCVTYEFNMNYAQGIVRSVKQTKRYLK
jgi:site-specific DNA-methyltransferase (adenine-specific)